MYSTSICLMILSPVTVTAAERHRFENYNSFGRPCVLIVICQFVFLFITHFEFGNGDMGLVLIEPRNRL